VSLLDHQLVVLHGKGGVGRTTMTAALGLAGALSGRRTCVVELGGQASLARTLGFDEPSYEPRDVAHGLQLRSLSLAATLSDFGARKLKIDALARWFFESRLMTGFVEAVPGLHDVVQLGKIENMISEPLPGEPVYDLVVLDAPATGHGLTLLGSARAMGEITRMGPFYELAHIIETFLADDARTGHGLIALPEPLPAQEALELGERLRVQGADVDALFLNQVHDEPLPPTVAAAALEAALGDRGASDSLYSLLAHARARLGRQQDALALLHESRLSDLPFVPVPAVHPTPRGVEALRPLAEAMLEVLR
jgi:anion-transporting  ArsA/GET3 family ATPase